MEKNKDVISLESNEKFNEGDRKKGKSLLSDWIIPIISAIVLALLINKFLVFNVYVPTESMVPTINKNDRFFVSRIYNTENLKRGEIVVFYSNEKQETLIKRLVGLPGDKIEIVNGEVAVNGANINEEYVKNKDNYYGSFEVPEGKYFFLGDNRPVSDDSRKWVNHYIDGKDIMGKAQVRIYPFTEFGSVK